MIFPQDDIWPMRFLYCGLSGLCLYCGVWGLVCMFYHNNGLNDWLVQRISSLVLLVYVSLLLGFWAYYAHVMTINLWRDFLFSPSMRALGLVSSFALLTHASIGIWVVLTDYVKFPIIQQVLLAAMYSIVVGSSFLAMMIFMVFG